MPLRNPEGWWKASRTMAVAAAAACIAAAIAAVALANAGGPRLFSIPLGEFLGVVAFPLLLAFAILRHAAWQERTDRRYSVWEEDRRA